MASSIGDDKAWKSLILDVDQDCIERRCRLMVLGMASRMVTLAITNKNQTTKRNMTDPEYFSGSAGVGGGGIGELKV